jgi:hypothetical protein
MSTWRPPCSAQGQFKLDATAAHPSKQLGHGQATSRARIDGRATRGLAETPAPRDLPADLGWPGECRADHASAPVGPSPSGHAQPASPNHRDQHHKRGAPGQASTDPTRPQRARPARYGEAAQLTASMWPSNCRTYSVVCDLRESLLVLNVNIRELCLRLPSTVARAAEE